jgi:hypothetical protein
VPPHPLRICERTWSRLRVSLVVKEFGSAVMQRWRENIWPLRFV